MESLNNHARVWQNRARILRMARLGMPEEQIAFLLGISFRIFQLMYADDIRYAVIQTNFEALEALWFLVKVRKNPTAILAWVKNRLFVPQKDTSSRKNRYSPTVKLEVVNHKGEVIG